MVGYNRDSSSITNCYSFGSVSGSGSVGGLVGDDSGSTTNNSFWDTETSGQSTSDGGTGKTTAEMQNQSTYTDAGWDFVYETTNGTDDIWDINTIDNNAYPFLYWQEYTPTVTTSTLLQLL